MHLRRFLPARNAIRIGVILACVCPLVTQSTSPAQPRISKAEAALQIRALAAQYPAIRALTPLEAQSMELCRHDCADIVDPKTGATAGQELERIAVQKLAEANKIADRIRKIIQTYILSSVSTQNPDLDRRRLSSDLRDILGQVSVDTPATYLLRSPGKHTLIVFYGIAKPFIDVEGASSIVLSAFQPDGKRLRSIGSADCGMNGYIALFSARLHSPVANEMWLLLTGKMSGANGPNIRMRIVAYSEHGFRMVWMPANAWGDFRVSLTNGGFRIDGSYYRSGRLRHDEYQLASDGVYFVQHRP